MKLIYFFCFLLSAVWGKSNPTKGIDKCDDCLLSIVTAGNTGAGKSFIDNLILGDDVFVHEPSAYSVTRETEHVVTTIDDKRIVVYNIPGLLEFHKENIPKNKIEIESAFKGKPAQILLFVTNAGVGGRVLGNDLATFLSLQEAFEIKHESVLFLINNVQSSKNPAKYEADCKFILREQLKWPENIELNVLFGPTLTTEIEEKTVSVSPKAIAFREKLLSELFKCIPHNYTLKKPIVVQDDVIKRLNDEGVELTRTIEELKKTHAAQYQSIIDKAERDQRESEKRIGELTNQLRNMPTGGGNRGKRSVSVGFGGFSANVVW